MVFQSLAFFICVLYLAFCIQDRKVKCIFAKLLIINKTHKFDFGNLPKYFKPAKYRSLICTLAEGLSCILASVHLFVLYYAHPQYETRPI